MVFSQPKLSIITPVLNGARFIDFCIRNVIEQRCGQAEHIIVDGGSTDGTVEIISKYAQEHGHIRCVSGPDRGQSDAMNKGVMAAAGEIIGFLNVDDYYEDGVLREVLPMFEHLPEPTFLVGNCNVWTDGEKLAWVSRPSQVGLLNLLKGKYEEAFPINPSAYFYHKSLHQRIGLYELGDVFAMDVHFVFRAVQNAHVKYVDRMWGNYRYFEGTRTFEDTKNGMNTGRVRNITAHYRKQQPLYLRAYLWLIEVWARILRAADGARSFMGKQ
jgi:glycosyltransferase involved in cell wall biosynthesis